MPGVSTGPSFMNRLGGQMPGMVNGLAQQFGDPQMQGAVQSSSRLLNRPRPNIQQSQAIPRMPMPQPMTQMPGTPMPPPTPPGIQTGPSTPPPFMNPMLGGMSGIGGMGGMNRNSMMGQQPTDIGGLFGRYNQMGQFPNRRY